MKKLLLFVYLFFLLWLTLFKFTTDLSWVLARWYPGGGVNLVPFAQSGSAIEIVSNFLVFVPFEFLLAINGRENSFLGKFGMIIGLSLFIEVTQFLLQIGAMDIIDLITNSAGGFFALIMYQLTKAWIPKKVLNKMVIALTILAICVFLAIILYLAQGGIRIR